MKRIPRRVASTLLVGLCFSLLSSCSVFDVGMFGDEASSDGPQLPNVVSILYGTDAVQARIDRNINYSGERAHRLEVGLAEVSVPKTHVPGKIERPGNYIVFQQTQDPDKHFVISSPPQVLSEKGFASFAKSLSSNGSALLYVHGYNNSFDVGLYRTAQLAYDFQVKGPVFYYSFPSRSDVTDYIYDVNSAEQSTFYLERYLKLIFKQAGVRKINIIAHSRGNDLVLKTLYQMSISNQLPAGCCGQLVMASPDVDRDVARKFVSSAISHFDKVTLYANNKDKALIASKALAGKVPRLGELQENLMPVIMAGMDSIDATDARQSFFDVNHDAYVDNSTLLSDIEYLIERGYQSPEKRTPAYQVVPVSGGRYWKLPN